MEPILRLTRSLSPGHTTPLIGKNKLLPQFVRWPKRWSGIYHIDGFHICHWDLNPVNKLAIRLEASISTFLRSLGCLATLCILEGWLTGWSWLSGTCWLPALSKKNELGGCHGHHSLQKNTEENKLKGSAGRCCYLKTTYYINKPQICYGEIYADMYSKSKVLKIPPIWQWSKNTLHITGLN